MKASRAQQLLYTISEEVNAFSGHLRECARRVGELSGDEEVDYALAQYLRKTRREVIDLADAPPPAEPKEVFDDDD